MLMLKHEYIEYPDDSVVLLGQKNRVMSFKSLPKMQSST